MALTVLKAANIRNNDISGEKSLACAVIGKAIEHLLQPLPHTRDEDRDFQDAKRFLLTHSHDLELWVEAADLDMDAVVSRSRSAYERFLEGEDETA